MHLLDAQTISWASAGGTTPIELVNNQLVTSILFARETQETGESQETTEPGVEGARRTRGASAAQGARRTRRVLGGTSRESGDQ